MDFDSYHRRN